MLWLSSLIQYGAVSFEKNDTLFGLISSVTCMSLIVATLLHRSYDGDCTTEPYSFHGVLNNFCFNYGTEETGYSFKYSYPTAAIYLGYNCTDLYQSEALTTTCEAVPYDSHQDDFYGYSWGTNELNTQWSFVSSKFVLFFRVAIYYIFCCVYTVLSYPLCVFVRVIVVVWYFFIFLVWQFDF